MLANLGAILLLTSPIWGIWLLWRFLWRLDGHLDLYQAERKRKLLIKDGVDPKDLKIIGNDLYINENFAANMNGR